MASSSDPKRYYHVFLSFKDADVRKSFLSHLYTALDQKGLHTFVDSEELRKGEEISPAFIRAMEESRVAIIIFSENYASSWWCLEELLKIMECKERNGLIVFPVFYKVELGEARSGRESYRRAIAKHESKFGKDSEKVKKWKKALSEASSLSGWNLNDRDEADLTQCIMEELSIRLVAKHPVGIDARVQELIWLSQKESADDNVFMIGLWGPGGIGKTTIAKALFNAIEKQFQGCSFLVRVRETPNSSNGLVALQKKLLFHIFKQDFMFDSVDEGIDLIKERLCCKKVLLVLDDVDCFQQLNALVGNGNWFGKGSKIIVTSRDKHLLLFWGTNFVYEVPTLEFNEALDLFHWHAFPNSKRVEIRRDIIHRVVQYAGGLPLALEVFGSILCGRGESAWESTLQKLSKTPELTINQVLKISFNGLADNEREIFLDIACFFRGESMMYIKEVLDSCDFDTTIGIEILIEKSLIKNENGFLQMHDLIQLMGTDIVNQECCDDPEKRSRLWLFEDVVDILSNHKGTDAVKAIVLNLREEITISPYAFTNLRRLRILILHGVHISSQGPVHLPNELRYVKWSNAPDLSFNYGPKKLQRIDLQKSHIRQFWRNLRGFMRLKSIDLRECNFLANVPDLSLSPFLESLSFDGCKSLMEIHQSVGYLEKLRLLSVEGCSNLSIFPNRLKTKYLEILRLSNCSKLEKFPDILEKMQHLKCLKLQGTAIKELPASIENFVSVSEIELAFCENLTRLPSSIYKLKTLKTLIIRKCSNLVMFPKNTKDSTDPDGDMGFQNLDLLVLSGCNLSKVEFLESSLSFPKLRHLNLSNNKFTHLPTCINKYNDLRYLFVRKCKQLQAIPELPSNLSLLNANSCESLQKLPDLSGHSSKDLQVELSLCSELLHKGVNLANVSLLEELPKKQAVDIIQSGREMPKWFLHGKGGSISFMVPRDTCGKFLGLAHCVVLSLEEGKVDGLSCEVQIFFNCQEVARHTRYFHLLESDHVWLYYVPRSKLRGIEKLQRNDRSHIQVCISSSKGSIKKCGFRLICEQQEDDLRGVLPTPSADRNKLKVLMEDSDEGNSMIFQLKQMKRKAHHL